MVRGAVHIGLVKIIASKSIEYQMNLEMLIEIKTKYEPT